jgi:hypothetical protein
LKISPHGPALNFLHIGQSSLSAPPGIEESWLPFVANPRAVIVGIVAPNSGGRPRFDLVGGTVSMKQ